MTRIRIAGIFYVLTFATGIFGLFVRSRFSDVSLQIGAACYVAVTLILYGVFKPVNGPLSAVAAAVSLAGMGNGVIQLVPLHVMVFFGMYCMLIGILALRSTFVPPVVGVLMVIAGLAWMTFVSPALTRSLRLYVLTAGFAGEGSLALWLLFTSAGRATAPASRPGVKVQ
jgi:hypothetical protein